MRRLMILLAAALALGGCNMVMAETPILTAADAEGAPSLRPGVWITRDPECRFNPRKRVKDWPECASPLLVGSDSLTNPMKQEEAAPYVLAAGEPRILQLELRPEPDAPRLYLFAGLQPLKFDRQGRIVEARTWAVQCGPPPPPKADAPAADPPADAAAADASPPSDAQARAEMEKMVSDALASGLTREPLPGMTVKDGMCVVRTVEPLRHAARESLAWDTESHTIIAWVRERP